MQAEDTSSSDALAPRNFNINDPDWPHAPHVYLIDPGPELRNQVTREWGRSQWALVVYDGMTGLSKLRQMQRISDGINAQVSSSAPLMK